MISIHQVYAWFYITLHYKLLCLRDYLISQDSGFKNRNTRCMPGYKLLCMGAIVQKRRCHASATRKRAKRSFRFPPAKHHMSCWTPMYTHYCFTKSNIYHLVSSYCFVQLSPPASYNITKVRTTILYYDTITILF